jgi:hypothetical protein
MIKFRYIIKTDTTTQFEAEPIVGVGLGRAKMGTEEQNRMNWLRF